MKTLSTMAIIFVILSLNSSAQIPRAISFQGVLADAQGNLIPDGNHQLQIVLYDQATNGNQVFVENQTIPVVKGIFNVIIGSVAVIPQSLSFDRAYFLGVRVDGGSELTPRTALTSVPYALRAERANIAESLSPNAAVVTRMNNQSGDVTLLGAGGTTVTNNGNAFTISSTGTGGTGIQGVHSTDGTIAIQNPNGPVATIGLNDGAITDSKLATGQVVKSINTLKDDVTLIASGGATVSTIGNTITIHAGSSSGGTGIQGIQNTDNSLDITNTGGPTTTINMKNQGITTSKLADGSVTNVKILSAQVVKSINTLKDDVTLAAGNNVTITPGGNTLTIAASGGGPSLWATNGNNISNTNPGDVGIGTSTPAAKLEVVVSGNNTVGVSGKNTSNGTSIGVRGESDGPSGSSGVLGFCSDGNGVFGYSVTGRAMYCLGNFLQENGIFEAHPTSTTWTTNKPATVKLINGVKVKLFTEESTEIYFTDYGEGQLTNGKTHIELDPTFLQTVTIDKIHPLKVFVQLEDECNGVFVTNKTASGFDIVELHSGMSNARVSYRIVCKRKYYEDERLATEEQDIRYNTNMLNTVWPEVIGKQKVERMKMEKMTNGNADQQIDQEQKSSNRTDTVK